MIRRIIDKLTSPEYGENEIHYLRVCPQKSGVMLECSSIELLHEELLDEKLEQGDVIEVEEVFDLDIPVDMENPDEVEYFGDSEAIEKSKNNDEEVKEDPKIKGPMMLKVLETRGGNKVGDNTEVELENMKPEDIQNE